jgi:short-subunit dehydrogenase
VINTASFAGHAGAPYMVTYGAAKAAVVALSEGLRGEGHSRGVQVSVVCPAFFPTNLCENFRGDERIRGLATKLMDKSGVTAEMVANEVFTQSQHGTFLIIPTSTERWRWRMKRWLPNFYFRELMKLTGARTQSARS